MSFISITFAAFFLLFISLYHISGNFKDKSVLIQQIVLLFANLTFYAFADIKFLPFLLYSIAISYFAGRFAKNKLLFIVFLLADLTPLVFFKYAPHDWHSHIIFPLGLSFFTFQSISYISDCYTRKIEAEQNPIFVAQFISFFPVISSGPIQRPGNLIPQFRTLHQFDYDNAVKGMKLFAWGMFKKLCIADRIALYVNYVYGNAESQYGAAILLATLLYSFQIYCDFSGYSDMAISLARYMGFDVGKNFDHPYLSKSVGEFWRRWHISLSSWLRDYIYIPLGGSRVALPRIYANLFITFLVSGIWHGSTWNFVIWGVLHGFYQCISRATKSFQDKLSLPDWLKIIITFSLISFAWIFFRTQTLNDAFTVIKKISEIPANIQELLIMKTEMGIKDSVKLLLSFNDESFGFLTGVIKFLLSLIIFIFISSLTYKKDGFELEKKLPAILKWLLYYILVLVLIFALCTGLSSNFIYNNF